MEHVRPESWFVENPDSAVVRQAARQQQDLSKSQICLPLAKYKIYARRFVNSGHKFYMVGI